MVIKVGSPTNQTWEKQAIWVAFERGGSDISEAVAVRKLPWERNFKSVLQKSKSKEGFEASRGFLWAGGLILW